MLDKFRQSIDEAQRILITAHISPDPDALCSVLLLGTTLRQNYLDKRVEMVLEEEPDGLKFVEGYEQIKFESLGQSVDNLKPDLVILVDVNDLDRCSREDGPRVRDYVRDNQAKLAIIDHHETDGAEPTDMFFNNKKPSAVQEVYELIFNQLQLQKPEHWAQVTMVGLYADTGGFVYVGPSDGETFGLVAELVKAGSSIETIKFQLNELSEDQLKVIGEMANNTSNFEGFTYSFIDDEYVGQWQEAGKPLPALQRPAKTFLDSYIRSTGGRMKGFIVYKNPLAGEDVYSVSFRSLRDAQDVSKLAVALNGGGHKSSAGGRISASSLEEAINQVKSVISQAA